MSMQRAEGFFHFDTAADYAAKGHASSNVSFSPSGGRGGRGCVTVSGQAYETLKTAQQTTFTHVAFNTSFRGGSQIYCCRNASNCNIIIQVNSDGSFTVYLADSLFGTSTGPIFPTNGATNLGSSTNLGIIRNDTWHHLMVKTKIHGSAGEVTVYIDGVQQFTFTGNTYCGAGALTTNIVGMGPQDGGSGVVKYSDLVIFDDQGSLNNTYGGDMAVYESVSPVDGDELDWTRSSGAGTWSSHVDDNPQDGDTTYLETSVIGDRVCFSFPTISSALGTIVAVKETVCHSKTEATTALLQLYSRSDDDIDHDGTTFACTEDYIFDERIYEQDLKDNSSWTAAKVNATQLGIVNVAA